MVEGNFKASHQRSTHGGIANRWRTDDCSIGTLFAQIEGLQDIEHAAFVARSCFVFFGEKSDLTDLHLHIDYLFFRRFTLKIHPICADTSDSARGCRQWSIGTIHRVVDDEKPDGHFGISITPLPDNLSDDKSTEAW